MPVLLATGDGAWRAINTAAPSWAHAAGAVVTPGDYDGNGRTDLAFHRPGSNWQTIPVLFARGDGTWSPTNATSGTLVHAAGAVAVAGDFNGDRRTDLAVHRPGSGWASVPVVLAAGEGRWRVTNEPTPAWASAGGVVALAGDYDRNGRTDLAFRRPGSGWQTLPVLLAQATSNPGTPSIGAASSLRLAAPFSHPGLFAPPVGVDHKAGAGVNDLDCLNHRGLPFPTCYDGHLGTDFLMAGGYTTMLLGSVTVQAAAPGVVHEVADGHFDRCGADPFAGTINCDGRLGREQQSNYVVIRQDDGLYAGYFHLQRDSVQVAVNQRVQCGTPLGRVGSSGISAYPHLHFHLSRTSNMNSATEALDPYREGLWNSLSLAGVPDGSCAAARPLEQTVQDAADVLAYNADALLSNLTGSAIEDGRYLLRLAQSGKLLDVSGNCVGQNGCSVQLWDIGASPGNNIIRIERQFTGGYKLYNGMTALEVRAEELMNSGGRVQVWAPYATAPHQVWLFYRINANRYLIRNAASLKVLSATAGCTGSNGCSVRQRDAGNNDPTQVWILERQ